MVLSCTKKQYERLVEKELEQQEKQLRAGEKKMEEQERLLELNRKLVSEKEYALLEQIQNDPELTQKNGQELCNVGYSRHVRSLEKDAGRYTAGCR